jgi:hypothetical protein
MKGDTITSPFGPLSFPVEAGLMPGVRFTPENDTFNLGEPLMAETARQL